MLKDQIRKEAPDPTVSGSNDTEMLENFYIKCQLFRIHMEKVIEFQKTWIKPESQHSLNQLFNEVNGTLYHLNAHLDQTLLGLNVSVPVVNTSVNLSTVSSDHDKQVYGYSVIVCLEELLNNFMERMFGHKHDDFSFNRFIRNQKTVAELCKEIHIV